MLLDLIEHYYLGLTISVFLLFFIREKNSFSRETNDYFVISAFCTLFLTLSDAAETILSVGTEPTAWRVMVSASGYVLRPAVAYFILMIAIRKASPRVKHLIAIPLVIDFLVVYSALFTDVAFGYDWNNQFYRGPLGWTPFMVGGFYGVMLVAVNIWMIRRSQWEEGVFILMIALLNVGGTYLESNFRMYGILPASISTSLTFYYLFFHTYQNDRDVLTGSLVRRRFYRDAERWHEEISGLVSIDLNGLKEINDLQGHKEGDKAIMALTSNVFRVLPKKANLYRTGGDEFMVLCRKMTEEEIREMMEGIRDGMEATAYSCAMGYALCKPEESLEDLCHRADEHMYENKARMKGEDGGRHYRRLKDRKASEKEIGRK